MKSLCKLLGHCRSKISYIAVALALAVGGLVSTASAEPAFTLPDTGVDVGEAITTTITAVGAIVLVMVGGYFAFLLIRRGLRWAKGAFG